VVGAVVDTADLLKVDFIIEYLCKYVVTGKKALVRGSGAQLEMFDYKTGV
jgi:hypothetical protein